MHQTYTGNQEEGVVTHIMVGHHPRVFTLCLPDITAPDQISQPLYLYTASDQILEVETAWERGYNQDTEACKAAHTQSIHTIKLLFDFTYHQDLWDEPTRRPLCQAPSRNLGKCYLH